LNLSDSALLDVLETELQRRRENERLAFFEPNGAQERFIQVVGAASDNVCVFSAANGVGKTTLVVNILGNIIFGQQNSFFSQPLFKSWPYPKRARYITESKLVEQIGPLHTEIEKWWPKGRYVAEKAGKTYYSLYLANGWVLDVMTYEQQVKEFEGVTLGVAVCDEPPPEAIFNATVTRFRSGGFMMVPMTPLTSAAYFFDRVVPNHPKSIVYASIEENCKDHGVRGQLEHKHIDQMIGDMPPDEVEARAHGKAMYLRGLVFKTFDYKMHVLKEPARPPLHATIYNVVDPHADKPFFAIWAWPHKNGDLYIFDEHPNEDFFRMHDNKWTRDDYKRMYAEKEQGYHVKRVIDRHFGDVRSAAYKKTLRDELAEIGMNYEPSYSATDGEVGEIDTGVMKVREYLKYNPDIPPSNINRPRLYINPHCLNTIKAFSRWSLDPKTGKYQDAYKDPMDVVRYLVMTNPKPSEPLPPQQFKKLYG
jgi:phage terminase large subunit-like protein